MTGGAGVVGHYAVQLARWAGARVIASVSSEEKTGHVKRAGAHAVINYRTEDLGARLRELTGGAGIDRVVDVEFGANLPAYVKALRPDAVVATYSSMKVPEPKLPFYDLMRLNFTLRMVFVYTLPRAAKERALADIARWIAIGRPKFAIAARFPLREIVTAHELVESGDKMGHVILDIS